MKKVLILEDEENIRSFVVINLKRAGYEAIEAATGQQATTDTVIENLLNEATEDVPNTMDGLPGAENTVCEIRN